MVGWKGVAAIEELGKVLIHCLLADPGSGEHFADACLLDSAADTS